MAPKLRHHLQPDGQRGGRRMRVAAADAIVQHAGPPVPVPVPVQAKSALLQMLLSKFWWGEMWATDVQRFAAAAVHLS